MYFNKTKRREEVNLSETCLKLYDKELSSLGNIYEKEKSSKDNLVAENHGLLALINIAKNIDDYESRDGLTNNLWDKIDNDIASELPNGIEIYSNITKRPISKEKMGKHKSETPRTSSIYFNLTN